MKPGKLKCMIAVAALVLAAATPTNEVKAQGDDPTQNAQGNGLTQNANNSAEWTAEPPPKMAGASTEKTPFGETRPPSYAPPSEGGDGQKIIPIGEELGILWGLSMVYGLVCKRRKAKD